MSRVVLITLMGSDRVGLISEVTGRLFDLGANLGDASFAVLGESCKFTCLADVDEALSATDITRELEGLATLAGARIEVSDFTRPPEAAANARSTHVIEVSGGDRPGLIARLSEVFVEFAANVVRMNSTRVRRSDGEAVYVTRFEVWLPPERAEACLSAVSNTAGQLQLDYRVRQIELG